MIFRSTRSFVNEKKKLTPKFILKILKPEMRKIEKEKTDSKLKRSLINFSRRLKRNFMLITCLMLEKSSETTQKKSLHYRRMSHTASCFGFPCGSISVKVI